MAVTTLSRTDQCVHIPPNHEITTSGYRHKIYAPFVAQGTEDRPEVLVSSHLFRPSDHSDS
jgi:hypothetical protein